MDAVIFEATGGTAGLVNLRNKFRSHNRKFEQVEVGAKVMEIMEEIEEDLVASASPKVSQANPGILR